MTGPNARFRRHLLALGAFAMALVIALQASDAADITYTDVQSDATSLTVAGVTPPNGVVLNIPLTLPQFDPGLGVLQNVLINVEVVAQNILITVTNTSTTETAVFTPASSFMVDEAPLYPAAPGGGVPALQIDPPQTLGPGGVHTRTLPPAFSLGGGTHTNLQPFLISPYIGTGSIAGSATSIRQINIAAISGLTNPTDLVTTGIYSATLRASVTYTYLAAAADVPEPATALLTALGMTYLASRRRFGDVGSAFLSEPRR